MGSQAPGLVEFFPGAVWLVDYPVRYAGSNFHARMSVLRLADGRLILHSPCEITPGLKAAVEALGPVGWIVAPGTFHHLHLASAQAAFPAAETWICPGVEKKQPGLAFDGFLGGAAPVAWAGELEQVLVDANRIIAEVVFFHRPSRTLIVTDLIEIIGPGTEGVDWVLKLWWKFLTFMWGKPRPAPEYTIGWRDRKAAAAALRQVLAWDFERIVLAHGDLVTENAKAVAEDAWAKVLRHG
jgi:hypothetical protein